VVLMTIQRVCAVVVLALGSMAASVQAAPITIFNSGPSSNRLDMVFLGDGYTATDISSGTYAAHINDYVSYMFAPGVNQDPFNRYRNFFNIHRIDVVSNQSGADVPPLGIFKDTALDATYYFDGTTERLLYVNDTKATAALDAGLVGAGFTAEMKFIPVNDTKYGGGGGFFSTFAGGNALASELALHEMAHSFSGLADEYGGFTTPYGGPEPTEPNVTTNSTGGKWSQWLGYNQPGIGVIGAYDGARYYDSGIYRPSLDSKMRTLERPFDAVSREQLILDIYALTNPLDSWLDNGSLLIDPVTLWVDSIDPNVINVQWFVDGAMLLDGEIFNLQNFTIGPGDHTITARAYDLTGFDSVNGWVRTNTSELEQLTTWNVRISPVPEPSGFALLALAAAACLRRRHRSKPHNPSPSFDPVLPAVTDDGRVHSGPLAG
jgi:hypothetical protein